MNSEPMRALRRISRAVWLVAGLVVVLVSAGLVQPPDTTATVRGFSPVT